MLGTSLIVLIMVVAALIYGQFMHWLGTKSAEYRAKKFMAQVSMQKAINVRLRLLAHDWVQQDACAHALEQIAVDPRSEGWMDHFRADQAAVRSRDAYWSFVADALSWGYEVPDGIADAAGLGVRREQARSEFPAPARVLTLS